MDNSAFAVVVLLLQSCRTNCSRSHPCLHCWSQRPENGVVVVVDSSVVSVVVCIPAVPYPVVQELFRLSIVATC